MDSQMMSTGQNMYSQLNSTFGSYKMEQVGYNETYGCIPSSWSHFNSFQHGPDQSTFNRVATYNSYTDYGYQSLPSPVISSASPSSPPMMPKTYKYSVENPIRQKNCMVNHSNEFNQYGFTCQNNGELEQESSVRTRNPACTVTLKPELCIICAALLKEGGRTCMACRKYRQRNKTKRTEKLWKKSEEKGSVTYQRRIEKCFTCGDDAYELEECVRCRTYRTRYNKPRPVRLWDTNKEFIPNPEKIECCICKRTQVIQLYKAGGGKRQCGTCYCAQRYRRNRHCSKKMTTTNETGASELAGCSDSKGQVVIDSGGVPYSETIEILDDIIPD